MDNYTPKPSRKRTPGAESDGDAPSLHHRTTETQDLQWPLADMEDSWQQGEQLH
jgi:hypothetical protein